MSISSVCFDIETFNLNADFGIVLCAVVKQEGKEPIIFQGNEYNKKWKTNRSDDSKLVRAISKELAKHPIWVAHNGLNFDIAYLNTRLIKSNLPPLPAPKVVFDTVKIARAKLRMSFNGLAQIANLLGCNTKTDMDTEVWTRAAYDGDIGALNLIVDHCVQDCITLEKVADKLKDLTTSFNHYGSGR